MVRCTLLAATLVLLTGCIGSPPSRTQMTTMSPAELLEATRWYAVDPSYLRWGEWTPSTFKRDLRHQIVEAHPDWPQDVREAVREGKIRPGMTAEQAQASWGPPAARRTRRTPGLVEEIWGYGRPRYGHTYSSPYSRRTRLYFRNGELDWWVLDDR